MTPKPVPSLLALCAAAFAVAPAQATPLDGIVSLEVLPGWRTDDGTHMSGFAIRLAPGWKTYWRAPGDAGIPPSFAWNGSENIAAAAFHWPVPEVMDQNGMRSIGYTSSVVIPVEFKLSDGAAPAHVRGEVQIGVCDDICVPAFLTFDAALPVDGPRTPSIVAALLDRPQTEGEASVGDVTCAIEPTDDGLRVTTRVSMPPFGAGETVVIEAGDQQVWVSEPQTWRQAGDLFARSDMIHVSGRAFALNRSDVRITVLAAGRSVDIQGCTAN